jgi:hypothetical protein
MITAILIVLVLGTGLLIAYTMKFQRAKLAYGKKIAPKDPLLQTGLQDAITPKVQTIRNILSGVLLLIILIYGVIFYVWYLGVVFALATFFIVSPILGQFLPKDDSDFYKQRIRKDLVKRQAKYRQAGDTIRETAIANIVRSLDKEKPISTDSEIVKEGMLERFQGGKK